MAQLNAVLAFVMGLADGPVESDLPVDAPRRSLRPSARAPESWEFKPGSPGFRHFMQGFSSADDGAPIYLPAR
jgi:hypothetical protein